MPQRFHSHFLWLLAATLSLAFLPGGVLAQAAPKDDLLEEAKRREQAAIQKAEADFKAALTELHRLAAKDPAKAAERSQRLLTTLQDDTILTSHKRESWKRMLQERIRVLQGEAAAKARADAERSDRVIKTDERRGDEAVKSKDDEKTRSAIDNVRKLQNDGRTDEAAKAGADVARRSPDNPAAAASGRIASGKQSLDEARNLRQERARRTDLALADVERSAMPPKGEIEFPPLEKWREITKRRTKSTLTETEKAIMKALNEPVTVNLKGSTFEGALNYLQTITGQTLLVDKGTLDSAGITYDSPVNAQARNITLRTLLRKLLGEFNLTYVVKDGAIQIVTPERAKEMMTVRTYYLGDLAFSTDFQFGPVFGAAQMAATVNQLIQTIVGSVDPDSWALNNNGGKGTIFFDPRTLSLIIKQNAEVHGMLGGFGR